MEPWHRRAACKGTWRPDLKRHRDGRIAVKYFHRSGARAVERDTLLPGVVSFASVARRRYREPELIAKKFTQLTTSLALGLDLLAPLSAIVLVGGPGIDHNSSSSPWNGVGSLNVRGNLFTATLIAPGYLLTAAHVVNGAAAANVSFKVNAGTSYSIVASQIFVNPDYTGSPAGNVPVDPTWHNVLAIIKMAGVAAADTPIYNLFTGNLLGADLHFVSYANSSTVKTTGENIADVLLSDAAHTNQAFLFDYDVSPLKPATYLAAARWVSTAKPPLWGVIRVARLSST